MPVYQLDKTSIYFPPPENAHETGLLAVGGELSPARIVEAYRNGIFPWFNPGEPPLWWSPDPRFVLFPHKLHVSKSMRPILRKNDFTVTYDQAFEQVIKACQQIYRPGQGGTWITNEMLLAYRELHKMGFIHSVEVWQNKQLVGGLYGGSMGKCFFGESMFAKVPNASKVGFIKLVKHLADAGFRLIDCQVHTKHLERFGAEMIPRTDFLKVLSDEFTTSFDTRNWNTLFRINNKNE